MTIRKLLFIGLIFATTLGAWEVSNRPLLEPTWFGAIDGFAYSPMRPGQSPGRQQFPSIAEIDADLAIIAQHSGSVRTYSLDGTLAEIPRLAAKYNMDVTAGVWLDEDLAANQSRLRKLQRTVAEHPNVKRVIIGNEMLLTETLSVQQLTAYLNAMSDQLEVPVSTAEPWHIWLANPALIASVDFVAVHLLPYWEGVPAGAAVGLVHQRMQELAGMFPDTPIVIGEVGWPSKGRSRGGASASRQDAERFLRRFLDSADSLGYEYFLMEAIDQPWKRIQEGEVGAYWGFFDGNRAPKYLLDKSLIPVPEWRSLALWAATFSGLAFLLLTTGARTMRWPGFALLAITVTSVVNAIVWSLHDYFQQYWTFNSVLAAIVLLIGILGMVLLIFIEAHEWAEAEFKPPGRLNSAQATSAGTANPKVSIHLPAYEEPPLMLVETLNALALLDYPNFEVIVVDNNTRSEDRWRPVEACCKSLGARFRFFHVAPLIGYKAGALNFALAQTAHDAEIIAVIDSDYRVEPNWLKQLVRHFDAPRTALVQAPQDYRDQDARVFKSMCEAEYRGFFKIGMVTRNERNAIIQHGTMTMIRASVLREVGGWAEWTITEDAELGLRILEQGHDSIYTTASLGRGLTPDRFRDYRTQRYRWALGATQILKRHGRALLGIEPSKLSLGQRFHFLTGWAAWLGDGLNLAFNFIAIAWSVLMVLFPLEFFPPVAVFSSFVLALFVFKLLKMTWLYSRVVGASSIETAKAVVAGLSLVFITGRAVVAGFYGSSARFVRTPKLAKLDNVVGALVCVSSEVLLAIALIGASIAVEATAPFETLDQRFWSILLIVFAIPHVAAVSLSLLGTLPLPSAARPAAQLHDAVTDTQQG
jgi:exo-beta-1,3-glucanase (GH17 family)/cellulose synthase/poly-beta-1,6-N-acetylglucosamine synthase-like glycosyltransferase